jgi:ADP-heptose:LPS heptosyltransferase
MSETTKIAIVKLSSLGDVIHAIPVAGGRPRARPRHHHAGVVVAPAEAPG